jgi:hypothetical protein
VLSQRGVTPEHPPLQARLRFGLVDTNDERDCVGCCGLWFTVWILPSFLIVYLLSLSITLSLPPSSAAEVSSPQKHCWLPDIRGGGWPNCSGHSRSYPHGSACLFMPSSIGSDTDGSADDSLTPTVCHVPGSAESSIGPSGMVSTCQNGRWRELPTCRTHCEVPPLPMPEMAWLPSEATTAACTTGDTVAPGTECQYRVPRGHTCEGDVSSGTHRLVCTDIGEWSGPMPDSCEANCTCFCHLYRSHGGWTSVRCHNECQVTCLIM